MIASVNGFASPEPQPLNPQPQRQDTIDRLLALGLPPLPVAPIQPDNSKFTGKNPSYLDTQGIPHLVKHGDFKSRQPTEDELKTWFSNPKNGIGTLGSEEVIWIDFDVKNFNDEVECSVKVWAIAAKVKEISGHEPTVERTHSGGWRVQVYVKEKPSFTNFALEPGGKHIGEALGVGRFTVLAPTIGPSGEPYTTYHRHSLDAKPVVPSLEAIGIYPSGKSKSKASKSASPAQTLTPKPRPTSVVGSVPLSQLISPDNQKILGGDKLKGDGSGSLTAMAKDLFGWENWCRDNDKTFSEDALTLFYEAGKRLGMDDRKIGRVLKTIDPSTCTPSASSYGSDEPCHLHYKRLASGRSFSGGIGSGSGGSGGNGNNRGGTGGTGGNGGDGNDNDKVVPFPGSETEDWVIHELDKLITQGVTGSALTGKLNRLAEASKFYVGELRTLYYERYNEADLENERGTHQGEIERLLRIAETSLELSDFLPPELAEPITIFCGWLSIRPAVALTALLAGVSSVHKVGTELVIKKNQNFRAPPNIYAAIISPSGQKKSPILDNLITLPLNQLSDEKEDAYKAEMEDYETAMQAWEKAEEKGEKPKEPKEPTLYYFTNATGESIPVQAAKDPDKALLGLVDELSGLFNSANCYRAGRGNDKQDLLSYFDGRGQTVLRVPGVRGKLKKIYLSIFGTIQPPILKRHVEDCSDPDGQWARFLFVNQPLEAATLNDDDDEGVQLHELLTDVYRQIDNLPAMEYRLSKEATKRYQPIYKELERLRVTHPKAGMRAVFSKMEGYIGRLALNLHVLWSLAAGEECPNEEIPLSILEKAIKLAKFYFGQVKLMHADSDDDSVPTQILRLIELSKRLNANGLDGWIKAQTYREQFASKKRPSAQQARDWMVEAVNLGYGRTRGSGNRLEYHWKFGDNGGDNDGGDNDKIPPTAPDDLGNLGKLREDLGKGVPYVETVENKGFEDNLGNLGKGYPLTPQEPTVENSLSQIQEMDADFNEVNFDPEPQESPPISGEPETPTFPQSTEGGGSVPEASLTSLTEPSNADAVSDDDLGNNLGNPFPNSSLSSLNDAQTQAQTLDDDLIKLGAVANEMIHCYTPAHVEKLYAEVPQELIEATKKRLGDDELLTFEFIANQCANLPPAAPEVAQGQTPDPTPKVEAITPAAQDNKDVPSTDAELVANAKRQGKAVFRYVGPMFPSGGHCLAPNVLVERVGVDGGVLVLVQKLGEAWKTPIGVGEKFLEEVV